MAYSNIKASFHKEVQEVWNVVTSLENQAWRSDVKKLDILDGGRKFIEYTEGGYSTAFTITAFEPCSRYEFDMENDNMHGHWTGLFTYENGVTTIDFTEDVMAKKWFMKPFVGSFLRKQQNAYVADLRKALERDSK